MPTPRPRIVVLGDLMLDVLLAPDGPLRLGTDVPGRVTFAQGGSAATTARWVARLGGRSTLVCSIGRDPAGRALAAELSGDGVSVRAARVPGARTGRIGVLVAPGGERSFVADRGAADRLQAGDLRPAWFARADVLHLPAYSLLGPLAEAGRRAIELARAAGAQVSIDLASLGPLLDAGPKTARALIADAQPDLLFATADEAEAFVGREAAELLGFAAAAVVKRGGKGATVLALDGEDLLRFEVATPHLTVRDTTGAGDAFDAGFLVAWVSARAEGRRLPAALQRATVAGHRAAARHLSTVRPELPIA
jgi:sugar/nucleoside kinase (ribokinase family)